MATSSKVRFDLDTLRTKAIETMEMRIKQAEDHVASFHDDEALARLINDWRDRQVAKVMALADQLMRDATQVDNHRLSKFRIEDIPEPSKYERRDAERELERLLTKRSQIVAKASSLRPDEDGTVSLTKTQLAEFFGL